MWWPYYYFKWITLKIQRMIDKYEGLKNIYDWLLELIIIKNDSLKYQTSQYFITSECNFEKYEGVFARVPH